MLTCRKGLQILTGDDSVITLARMEWLQCNHRSTKRRTAVQAAESSRCVRQKDLTHWLPCTKRPCHYQVKRSSDADVFGAQVRSVQAFSYPRPNSPGITVSFAKHYLHHWERQRRKTCLYFSHAISFIRGHYGKVATKAPSGRETGASAQAAIHLQHRTVPNRSVHLPHQNNPQGLFILQASVCLSTYELRAGRLPLAIVSLCSFFIQCRIVLLISKEVFNHTQSTPVLGHVGSRGAIPQPRKARVASD